MRAALLAAAASIAAIAIPAASAQAQTGSGFAASHGGPSAATRAFQRDDHERRDRRRDRGSNRATFFGDRDYQGDSAWRPDSFNDWWHERPHRAYPAWMSRNKNCERLWWSGGGWTC